ncbi:MAG: von Willebrand factor type A domain-containing protein [Thermoanaerobaculia bacterium]
MSRWSEREIARKLAERDELEPPPVLLEKIKSEIPPEIPVGIGVPEIDRRPAMPPRQRWLIAASLVATVGAGLFALHLQREVPPVQEPARVASGLRQPAPPPRVVPPPPPAVPPPVVGAVPRSLAKTEEAPAPQRLSRRDEEKLKSLGYVSSEARGRGEGGVVGGLSGAPAVPASEPAPAPAPPEVQAPAAEKDKKERAAEAPLLNERRAGTGASQSSRAKSQGIAPTISQSDLEKVPTARDPWAVLQSTPGVVTDRINVGGNEAGQQSRYVGPGSGGDQAVWSVDGTVITDMKALGSSPSYYDFDAYEEMRVTNSSDKAAPLAKPNALFKSAAVNPFEETAKDRLSTFGLDVDTASYTVARQYLTSGQLPVPASVRVEEYVNFFDYGDAPPTHGDFAIKAEGGPTPFTQGPQYRLLRFNLRSREVRMDNRRPVVLTFLIDVSGSMDVPNRLGLVKQSLSLLLDQLRPSDRIGLVVFGSNARVLLEPTNDREAVRRAIAKLVPEGATNLEEGLTVAYQVAGRNLRPNAANRVILCSDGGANVGHAGPQAILGQIGREARRGIELTTLGFGMGDYNDNLMEQLADKGDGRNAYIDTLDEAKRVLVEEASGTLNTIAKDAKTQVELNPAVVARYRLLGYENRAIADERFRDNRVIAGQIGSGHSVTALYEVELRPDAPKDGVVATLRLRYRSPEIGNITETEKRLQLSELAPSWEKASPGFRLAALVAQFAEILKGSPWARGNLADVARQVQTAAKTLPKSAANPRFSELRELVEKAARIKGGKEER